MFLFNKNSILENQEHQNIEQRNMEHWQNSRTLQKVAEQLNITRNTRTKPYQNEMEPYKMRNNYSVFKRKFKTQNLNFQLKVEIFLLLI